MKKLKVLVACEESQRVCIAFRERGFEAFSADIQEPSGGHPEWHILGDVLKVLNPRYDAYNNRNGILFHTMTGQMHFVPKWDLIIAHPPCTYLTVTGNRWFNVEKYGDKAIERHRLRKEAVDFFFEFSVASCEHVAIENPVGVMSTYWRKPDQIIQPYQFGEPYEKKTCLWLKRLPPLQNTNVVKPPERKVFESGKSMATWYANCWHLSKEERQKIRSQTFEGIAQAMAEQWSKYLCEIPEST